MPRTHYFIVLSSISNVVYVFGGILSHYIHYFIILCNIHKVLLFCGTLTHYIHYFIVLSSISNVVYFFGGTLTHWIHYFIVISSISNVVYFFGRKVTHWNDLFWIISLWMYKANEKEMWGVPTGTPRSPTYIGALYWLWLQSGLCLTLILRLPIARVNFGRWIKVGLDMIRHLIRDHRTSQSGPWLRGLRRGVNKTFSRSPATYNSTATTTAAKYIGATVFWCSPVRKEIGSKFKKSPALGALGTAPPTPLLYHNHAKRNSTDISDKSLYNCNHFCPASHNAWDKASQTGSSRCRFGWHVFSIVSVYHHAKLRTLLFDCLITV